MARLSASLIGIIVLMTSVAAAAADTTMPSIIHEPCPTYEKGKPFEIIARFKDESPIFDPKVIYWTKSDPTWRNAPFVKRPDSEDFVAAIKTTKLKGTIQYFIEVFDEMGNGPARFGSGDAPNEVSPTREPPNCEQVPEIAAPVTLAPSAEPVVAPPVQRPDARAALTAPVVPPEASCDMASRPLYCEPWLWATIGVVLLAGGGAAVYLITREKENEHTPTHPDVVNLSVTGPNPTALEALP